MLAISSLFFRLTVIKKCINVTEFVHNRFAHKLTARKYCKCLECTVCMQNSRTSYKCLSKLKTVISNLWSHVYICVINCDCLTINSFLASLFVGPDIVFAWIKFKTTPLYSQLNFLDFLRLNIQVILPSKTHPLFLLGFGSQFQDMLCCRVHS